MRRAGEKALAVNREEARLVRVERGDVSRAAEPLAVAFRDYPLLVHAASDPEARARLARLFCLVALHYAARYGEVYATSQSLEGVAAWIPSPHFPLGSWKLLRAVPLRVLAGLGRSGGVRLRAPGAYLDAMHRRLAPPDHMVLFILGVAPPVQGQGYAGRLLRPVLGRLDREGRPCYVDTVNGDAVPMYEHFGFRVLEQAPIPGTGLTAWALLREPPRSVA